jgi:hypothetical protein
MSDGMKMMTINIEVVIKETAAFFACGQYKVILQPPLLLEKFFCNEYPRLIDNYWLAMLNSIKVILEEFIPMRDYFANECLPGTGAIINFLRHPFAIPYLVFFCGIFDFFTETLRSIEQNLDTVVARIAHVQLMKDNIVKAALENPKWIRVITKMNEENETVYSSIIEDMNMFLRFFYATLDSKLAPFEPFKCLQWMCLCRLVEWNDISSCLQFFINQNVVLDHDKLLRQHEILSEFVNTKFKQRAKFLTLSVDKKWASFFKKTAENEHSELLKMVQCVFAFMMRADHAEKAILPVTKDFRWTLPNEVDLRIGYFRRGLCVASDTVQALLVVLLNLQNVRPCYLIDLLRSEKTLMEQFRPN